MSDLLLRNREKATRGDEAMAERLIEQHADIRALEARLTGARRRRALLTLKLVTAGVTERSIAALIGVTSSHVHQWKTKAEAERRSTRGEGGDG